MLLTQPLGPLLAAGSSADVYALGANHALKLYHHGTRPDAAHCEADNARAARNAGIPTPAVVDAIEHDGRIGLVFERVEGPTMLQYIGANPDAAEAQAADLAHLHAQMHRRPGAGLPPQRRQLDAAIARITGLQAAPRAVLTAAVERVSQGSWLCHGDFHPGNVVLTASGPSIIDWYGATCGLPALDAARTVLLLQHAPVPRGTATAAFRAGFAAAYLRAYCAISGVRDTEIAACMLPAAAARLGYTRSAAELHTLAQLVADLLGEMPA